MNCIRFGFQTYAWFMTMERFGGKIGHTMHITAAAGLSGIESTPAFLAENFDAEYVLKESRSTGVNFVALALGLPWLNDDETEEEYILAEKAIDFVSKLEGTQLSLSHKPVGSRDGDLRKKQEKQIKIVNGIARRAAEKGVVCAYHANSFENAYFRTQEDYLHLFSLLDTSVIGWVPDIGHMANGNCDVSHLLKMFSNNIRHVHFKDMDENHNWVPMGKGIIDFPRITEELLNLEYKGWIMVEDESAASLSDPDRVALENGEYINTHLLKYAQARQCKI